MNISIFASIGCQNLGDELILKNEIELLKQEFGDATYFKVASYDYKNPVFKIENTQYFEYFPFGIKKLKNILRNIRNLLKFLQVIIWSDIVVIGGGGIIYDSEKQSVSDPLDQWVFRTKIARFFRKKIYFYAIGIDIKKSENIEKLTQIFRKAYKVTVRDKESQKQLESIGINSETVDDPVMSDSLDTPRPLLGAFSSQDFTIRDLDKFEFQGKKVGLALRSGYIGKTKNKKIENLLIAELCSYIESEGGSIVFLPHSFHDSDSIANDALFLGQFIQGGREVCKSMQEVYEVYTERKIDVLISMRLHSMILAHVHGLDQIAFSYSQKTDEFLKKVSQ